ncbi:hypothetical protein BH23BAC3_BH23BAC3_30560 [soil metagenome]
MKTKSLYTQFLAIGIIMLFSLFSEPVAAQGRGEDRRPTEHNLVIKIIDNEWRVVLRDDESRSTVIAKRGDRIRWSVEDSDASFQFEDENLFGNNTRTVKAGNLLVLAVGDGARVGSYTYAVFIHKDLRFARGESPPRIFVARM